ncbi:MAG TPA: (2Fe-2S)-binding protein [Candidatus Dormibacteraeota bacterium]|nr:(2Fe-2S)-binding protein [Candidatus Dormibacteraeota bacterium]
MSDEDDALKRAILDSYKVVCICNKIRKGVIEKAIRSGARTLEDIRRRTRACTGPCTPNRCGPVIRQMLADAERARVDRGSGAV